MSLGCTPNRERSFFKFILAAEYTIVVIENHREIMLNIEGLKDLASILQEIIVN